MRNDYSDTVNKIAVVGIVLAVLWIGYSLLSLAF